MRSLKTVTEPTRPGMTFEAMLRGLRNRVRDEIGVSEDLATAIVAEWRIEAMKRGLIWFEDAYWSEAVLWIEEVFPPGLRSVTTFVAPRVPSKASARPPRQPARRRQLSPLRTRRRGGQSPP